MKKAAGASPAALFIPCSGGPDTKICPAPVPTPCPAGYTGAEEGSVNGMFRWNGGGYLLGIFAIALGSGILIAAIFPVGALLFLVAFLLIACGCGCCRRR